MEQQKSNRCFACLLYSFLVYNILFNIYIVCVVFNLKYTQYVKKNIYINFLMTPPFSNHCFIEIFLQQFKVHTIMHIGQSKALYMIIRHCHLLYMYSGQIESNTIKKVTMDFVEQRISFDLLNLYIWEFIIGLAGLTVYKKNQQNDSRPLIVLYFIVSLCHILYWLIPLIWNYWDDIFLDLAVSGFKTDQVVVLRTRPVAHVTADILTTPGYIPINSTGLECNLGSDIPCVTLNIRFLVSGKGLEKGVCTYSIS